MALSLNTENTPEGIKCSYEDGRLVGVITYNADFNDWTVEPFVGNVAASWCMPEHRAFASLEAAQFYMLAVAAEREAVARL